MHRNQMHSIAIAEDVKKVKELERTEDKPRTVNVVIALIFS